MSDTSSGPRPQATIPWKYLKTPHARMVAPITGRYSSLSVHKGGARRTRVLMHALGLLDKQRYLLYSFKETEGSPAIVYLELLTGLTAKEAVQRLDTLAEETLSRETEPVAEGYPRHLTASQLNMWFNKVEFANACSEWRAPPGVDKTALANQNIEWPSLQTMVACFLQAHAPLGDVPSAREQVQQALAEGALRKPKQGNEEVDLLMDVLATWLEHLPEGRRDLALQLRNALPFSDRNMSAQETAFAMRTRGRTKLFEFVRHMMQHFMPTDYLFKSQALLDEFLQSNPSIEIRRERCKQAQVHIGPVPVRLPLLDVYTYLVGQPDFLSSLLTWCNYEALSD